MVRSVLRALVVVVVLGLLPAGLAPAAGAQVGGPAAPPPGRYDLVVTTTKEQRCEGSPYVCDQLQYQAGVSRRESVRGMYIDPQVEGGQQSPRRATVSVKPGCAAPERAAERFPTYLANVSYATYDGRWLDEGFIWRAGTQRVRHHFVCQGWGLNAWVTTIEVNEPTWRWRSDNDGPQPPVDCGGGRLLGPAERDQFAANLAAAGAGEEEVASARMEPCAWLDAATSDLVVSETSEGIPADGVVIGPPLVAGTPYAGVAPDPQAQAAAEYDCTGGIPRPPVVSSGAPRPEGSDGYDATWFARTCKNVVSAATADGQPRGAVYNGVLIAQVNAAMGFVERERFGIRYAPGTIAYNGVHTAEYKPAAGSRAYPYSLGLDYTIRPYGAVVSVPLVGGLSTGTPDPGTQAMTQTAEEQQERSLRTQNASRVFSGLVLGIHTEVRATATFGVADWTSTMYHTQGFRL